jgi:chromosome partitioning protein
MCENLPKETSKRRLWDMKTISVANQKGGCGKTTTAINLASALASIGKKVLIIDLDPQSHATFGLGVTNQAVDKSVYNVLTDNPEKRRNLEDCISKVEQNLDIVASNILLSTLEQELKDKEDAVSRLHQVLSAAHISYHYGIIDCPPSLGFLTFNALRAADLVMVPIDMSAFSLMGVGKLLGMLELIKLKINHAPRVRALATLFDRRTKYSQVMLDEIKGFFKEQMLATVIRVSIALKKAAAKGVSVIRFDKESNGAADYLALAEELAKLEVSEIFEEVLHEVTAAQAEVPAAEATVKLAVAAETRGSDLMTAEEPGIAILPVAEPAIMAPAPAPEPPPAEKTAPEPPAREQAVIGLTPIPAERPFALSAPGAKEAYLVGDFNHWKMNDDSRLSRLEDGRWEKKIMLSPGRYRYKFVVDGVWLLDPQNAEKEQNPYGTFDSIIMV